MEGDIFNKAWTTTYAIISGNVPDPINRGSKWIWAANPLIGSPTDPSLSYPIITIDPFTVSSSEPVTFGTKQIETTLATTIEVHDNAGGSRFDAICNDLVKALWDNAEEFAKSGLDFMFLSNGIYNQVVLSRTNRIHTKSFGLEFRI